VQRARISRDVLLLMHYFPNNTFLGYSGNEFFHMKVSELFYSILVIENKER